MMKWQNFQVQLILFAGLTLLEKLSLLNFALVARYLPYLDLQNYLSPEM